MLDNVTINQLRAFVAVCDQGSFSGAARELKRAQSAVSHAIKALESAFNVQLFERNTRKATLTAAGRSLLPDARAVISRTEEMKMSLLKLWRDSHSSPLRSCWRESWRTGTRKRSLVSTGFFPNQWKSMCWCARLNLYSAKGAELFVRLMYLAIERYNHQERDRVTSNIPSSGEKSPS